MAREELILVIEDDRPTRTFLADNLLADGFEVIQAENAAKARAELEARDPDLAILDLGLPDGDGLALLRQVRAGEHAAGWVSPSLPVIVLSGHTSGIDKVRGLQLGCDDYVTKPFDYRELHARIDAVLRRVRGEVGNPRLRVAGLEIDPVSRHVWLGGEQVLLSKKEFALLHTLAGEPTRCFTREELLRSVWHYRTLGATRTLDTHASRLRRKLAEHGEHRLIVNVWGVGYRLIDGPQSLP